jgi:hypothetical protein
MTLLKSITTSSMPFQSLIGIMFLLSKGEKIPSKVLAPFFGYFKWR